MAIRNLNEQIERLGVAIDRAMLTPGTDNAGLVKVEFLKLKFMLDGLASFVEHRWQVKLIFGTFVVSELIDIKAEHLEEARTKAIELFDQYDSALNYELYCDGIQISEEN